MSKLLSTVTKLANEHIKLMAESKMLSKKKKEIAKISFIIGFNTALKLQEENKTDTVGE